MGAGAFARPAAVGDCPAGRRVVLRPDGHGHGWDLLDTGTAPGADIDAFLAAELEPRPAVRRWPATVGVRTGNYRHARMPRPRAARGGARETLAG